MSEIEATRRSLRADAERSVAAILDAALALLAERSDASMNEIAAAAGVARQTVYAHFRSRDALLAAVAERARSDALAAIDAAEPERGAPAEALARLVPAWWSTVERHARVLEALAPTFADASAAHDFHAPILERVATLVRRGRRSGDFDRKHPVAWMVAAFLALMHAAAEEVAAERMSARQAARALEWTVPQMFGVTVE